ncbi:hypothetical protein H5410_044068 [Solanum commersonii]|uniref:Uncharacterized protein n=1 Tax=Solanum commersonii TaxID=4109 RepID=A0A9J5Y0Q3_SOLCO|nr:hypothetical protein H5410_044068 [Solanum commersonii]
MEPIGPHNQNGPFSRHHFCQKILRTFVKTLAIESIGSHNQNDPFSRSNKPQRNYEASFPSWPKRPTFKVKQTLEQNFTWTSVKTLSIELVGPYGQNGLFSRSNEPQSRKTPYFTDFHVL